MHIECVVNLSLDVPGQDQAQVVDFLLSNYKPTSDQSAFRCLKDAVFTKAQQSRHVYWIAIGFMIIDDEVSGLTPDSSNTGSLITAMRGDIEWFEHVEYFQKLIGDMGSSVDIVPSGYGFIDKQHNIRVEFENGVVWLSSI